MKVALYQPWIYLHGGLERSILELVTRSRHEWMVFTGHYEPDATFAGFAARDVRILRPTGVDRRLGGVLKSAIQVARQKLPLPNDVNVIVVCCDGIGDLITIRNRSLPIYNICFTPLRAAFDPSYETMALKYRRRVQRGAYHLFKHAFRLVDRLAWRRYAGVMAISEEVKRRIVTGRLYPEHRIEVAHPGIDWVAEPGEPVYEPFALVAGRIMWTKNIELAIRAFLSAELPPPWRLVIAGYVDRKSTNYLAQLRALAAGHERIVFIVSPSDEVLGDLQRRASFCLFTPLNEDWGLVPLEAMVHCKPVLANDAGGPRESVLHRRTGYLLPPDDVCAWSDAMRELVATPELVRRMGQNGHLHVQRFTWTRFTAAVDDALDRCVERHGVGGHGFGGHCTGPPAWQLPADQPPRLPSAEISAVATIAQPAPEMRNADPRVDDG